MDSCARPSAYVVWEPRTRDRARQTSGILHPNRLREGYGPPHSCGTAARASTCGERIRRVRTRAFEMLSPAKSRQLARQS
jgi:hypothetical protein